MISSDYSALYASALSGASTSSQSSGYSAETISAVSNMLTASGVSGVDVSSILGSSLSSGTTNTDSQASTDNISSLLNSDVSSYVDYLNSSSSSAYGTDSTSSLGVLTDTSSESYSELITSYLNSMFPNLGDDAVANLASLYTSQYEEYSAMMDSATGSVSGSSGSSSGVYGTYSAASANQGVDGLLSDAGSMVGLTESGDTAAINQVTGESGIDCSTTPWCAAFAMNMLNDHGVLDTSSCSNVNYCPTIESWSQGQGTWEDQGSGYTPQAGDAILFDWNGDGTAQHIGIVEKVENGKVYTIEGNSSDSVKKNSYSLNSGSITGYINCASQG